MTQAKRTLASDQTLLAVETQLRAPSAGTVLTVNVLAGQLSTYANDTASSGGAAASSSSSSSSSSGGSSAAIVIATDTQPQVLANVAEADIASLQVGDPVALTFNAYPGKTFTGKVTSLPLVASSSSSVTTYAVYVTVNGKGQGLMPGMTANLTIVTAQKQGVMVVPTQAVQTTSFGSFVTTINSHDQQVRTPVQTGLSDVNNTEITGGLTTGERILVSAPSGATGGATAGFGGGRGGGFGGGRGGFGGGVVRGGGGGS